MAQFRKKGVWFTAALFAMGLAVVVWWGLQDMHRNVAVHSDQISLSGDADPIEEFRTTRQQLRAMQKAQLNDVAHDADTDEELAAMAQRQLLLLCEREEQELTLEGILQMRGWERTVVTVHENSVNVLLSAQTLTQQESSVIMELVCRETGIMSGNVKIIPIN